MVAHADLTGANLHEPKGAAAATSGQVYVADGVGSGAWSKPAGSNVTITDSGGYFAGADAETVLQELGALIINRHYSELFVTANSTAETPTGAGTYDTWTTGWSAGLNSGMTQSTGAGTIQVADTGIYEVTAVISSSQSAASAADWLFSIGHDTGAGLTAVTKAIVARTTSITDVDTVSISAIYSMAATEKVGILYQRASGTPTLTIEYANLSIRRLA